jgi:hypothetical protein
MIVFMMNKIRLPNIDFCFFFWPTTGSSTFPLHYCIVVHATARARAIIHAAVCRSNLFVIRTPADDRHARCSTIFKKRTSTRGTYIANGIGRLFWGGRGEQCVQWASFPVENRVVPRSDTHSSSTCLLARVEFSRMFYTFIPEREFL